MRPWNRAGSRAAPKNSKNRQAAGCALEQISARLARYHCEERRARRTNPDRASAQSSEIGSPRSRGRSDGGGLIRSKPTLVFEPDIRQILADEVARRDGPTFQGNRGCDDAVPPQKR